MTYKFSFSFITRSEEDNEESTSISAQPNMEEDSQAENSSLDFSPLESSTERTNKQGNLNRHVKITILNNNDAFIG